MKLLTKYSKKSSGDLVILLKDGCGNLTGTSAGTVFQFIKVDSGDDKFCCVRDLDNSTTHNGLRYTDYKDNPRFRLAYKNEAKEHRYNTGGYTN